MARLALRERSPGHGQGNRGFLGRTGCRSVSQPQPPNSRQQGLNFGELTGTRAGLRRSHLHRKQSSLSIGALADRNLLPIEIEHEESNGRR